MTATLEVLRLAERQFREPTLPVPEGVLESIVRATGARGGVLRRGDAVVARTGAEQPASRRVELATVADAFSLELVGGEEPEASLATVARITLATWAMREELKNARFAERRRLWEVESLRAIAEVLGGTLEVDAIAETMVLHSTALLDARRGEVWLPAHGSWRPAARVGGTVLTDAEVEALADGGLLEERRIAVPFVGRRGRLGVVALADREVRGGLAAFAATDAETLALFASQAAVALENASLHHEAMERQLLERELELAAAIQRELLPREIAPLPGFEIGALTEPCRQVGGDVYDLIAAPDGMLLILGDVTGKGVPAALMAASLQAAVRVLGRACPAVVDLAHQINHYLVGATPENKFATVFLGCLRAGGELEYVSAGHNPAVLASADGTVRLLHSSGPPFGLLTDADYPSERVQMAPGDLLLAYTDGFSEAPGTGTDEDFGIERLVELTVAMRGEPFARLAEELFAAVARHTGGTPPHDDRTLLMVRRRQE
jgi:sigma-B regulation protein RsbU (phosphoserine phosphatase)